LSLALIVMLVEHDEYCCHTLRFNFHLIDTFFLSKPFLFMDSCIASAFLGVDDGDGCHTSVFALSVIEQENGTNISCYMCRRMGH